MNKHILFGSNNETEIMFYEFRNEIVIQRINIENNHNGCFTKIIKVFSGIDGVQSIRIQSVLTREMAKWCNKNGYKPVGYCEKLEDYIVGDYVKHYK